MSVLVAPVRSFAAADIRKRVDSRTVDAIVSATHATKHIIIITSNQPPAAMICLIRQESTCARNDQPDGSLTRVWL